ncbi:hypothetical protein JB92DRAFT_3081003 [Gautieria morchelliformis]|nr:hypothetical protein JB92DRAFT_3081003 [Gautieria morchelliformis]
MKVVHLDDCLLHNPPHEILSGNKISYLESPTRYLAVREALSDAVHTVDYVNYLRDAYENWVQDGGDKVSALSTAGVLPDTFFHSKLARSRSYDVTHMTPIAKAGVYCFDLSTPIMEETYHSAVSAVRVALTASRLLSAQTREHYGTGSAAGGPLGVFALTRPPGHHAGSSLCGGYCYINNVAIAARFLQSEYRTLAKSAAKVAILDVDYHHGNGTQEIFYEDPSVFYVSLHATQDYPYFTGAPDERGTGEGTGFNLNIPLPKRSTGDAEYQVALQRALEEIRLYDPVYLIVSLGVDTFENDPICEFRLSTEGYVPIGRAVAALEKPTLFVLEGGYDLGTLGLNVRAVLEGFEIK